MWFYLELCSFNSGPNLTYFSVILISYYLIFNNYFDQQILRIFILVGIYKTVSILVLYIGITVHFSTQVYTYNKHMSSVTCTYNKNQVCLVMSTP